MNDYYLRLDNSNTHIHAVKLHAKYLGEEVYVKRPDREGAVIGTLESFKVTKATDDSENFTDYNVTIVVSGLKLKLSGDARVVLMDGGALPSF